VDCPVRCPVSLALPLSVRWICLALRERALDAGLEEVLSVPLRAVEPRRGWILSIRDAAGKSSSLRRARTVAGRMSGVFLDTPNPGLSRFLERLAPLSHGLPGSGPVPGQPQRQSQLSFGGYRLTRRPDSGTTNADSKMSAPLPHPIPGFMHTNSATHPFNK
jgi:hypothetical protein